jgi:hypothetical protein
MQAVYDYCLGKTKQQIFDYCVANNVSIDTIFIVSEKADAEIPSLEQELIELDSCYIYEEDTNSWYASQYTYDRESEIKHEIEVLKALRDNAEDVYSMLDDYYAKNDMYNL